MDYEKAYSEDERIRKEINTLYSEIDTCISELLEARTDKDSEAEGKALFKMEGLMVATLQDLSCIEDYLEKQKEHFRDDTKKVEQKPAQTDDEKEYIRTIKSIISDFIRDKKPEDVAYYQRIYNWLDGRHIEQKPAEWSEEDNIIKNVISYLNGEYGFKTHDDDYTYRKGLIRQLKSLRPHHPQLQWKPSEEQMKGLKFFLDFHRSQRNAGTTNWREYDAIESLYEQLKKLM